MKRPVKEFEELISRVGNFLEVLVQTAQGPIPLGRKPSEW
jgi:hypothetical protein